MRTLPVLIVAFLSKRDNPKSSDLLTTAAHTTIHLLLQNLGFIRTRPLKMIMEYEIPEDHLVVEYVIPEDETVSIAAVRAVSSLKECDPSDLTPLYETIDPEMLNDLCESQQDGTVKFVFSDFHITVENGEYLTLRESH